MGKRQHLSASTISLIVIGALLALVILAGAFLAIRVGAMKTIYPNVYVAGINVGGMTREQAVDALNKQLKETYGSTTLEVKLQDRTLKFTPEVVGAKLNAEEAVASAWSFGRYGNLFSRISSYLKAKRAAAAFTVNAGVTIDETAIRALITETAAAVKTDEVDSVAAVNKDADNITVTIGKTGVTLDVDALFNQVKTAILKNDFTPISFDYTKTAYPALDLSTIYNELHTSVADAYFDAATHTIVAEQIGYGFDLAAANQQVAMASDGDTLTIKLEEIQPTTTKAQLEAIYFADVLASKQTVASGNSNRVNNMTLACQAINGTILAPGETFSYNNTLGERTAEKGYKEAGAYVSGKTVTEVGGGICQVSSTLYYCTLYSNLQIVARTNHMFTVGYLPLGLDATVSWGAPDFQFKNNTEYPIRIDASVSGGMVNVSIIGTKTDKTHVEMTSETLATIPYTTVTTTNPSEVVSSGHTGYNVVTYRHIIDDETGKELSVTLEGYSYYSKSDIVVLQQTINEKVTEKMNEETETAATTASTAASTAAESGSTGVVSPVG